MTKSATHCEDSIYAGDSRATKRFIYAELLNLGCFLPKSMEAPVSRQTDTTACCTKSDEITIIDLRGTPVYTFSTPNGSFSTPEGSFTFTERWSPPPPSLRKACMKYTLSCCSWIVLDTCLFAYLFLKHETNCRKEDGKRGLVIFLALKK